MDRKTKRKLLNHILIGSIASLLLFVLFYFDKKNPFGLFNGLKIEEEINKNIETSEIILIVLIFSFVLSLIYSIIQLIRINKIEDDKVLKTIDIISTANIIPILLSILIFIDSFFLSPVSVSGSSMKNSLDPNDYLLTSRITKKLDIDDIVIIEAETDYFIIKRVVAKEGDHLVVTAYGEVYVNDELIEDGDGYYSKGSVIPYDKVLEKNEIYVLGDNRNISVDSRIRGIFDMDSVKAKVLFRFGKISKMKIVKDIK